MATDEAFEPLDPASTSPRDRRIDELLGSLMEAFAEQPEAAKHQPKRPLPEPTTRMAVRVSVQLAWTEFRRILQPESQSLTPWARGRMLRCVEERCRVLDDSHKYASVEEYLQDARRPLWT